jgi:hypothetical protein
MAVQEFASTPARSKYGLAPIKTSYTKFDNLRSAAPGSRVNIVAVILAVGELTAFDKGCRVKNTQDKTMEEHLETAEDGDQRRLELQLVNQTNYVFCVAMWNEKADKFAETFQGGRGDGIKLKGVVIVTHGGVSLNIYHSTIIILNPKGTKINTIKQW